MVIGELPGRSSERVLSGYRVQRRLHNIPERTTAPEILNIRTGAAGAGRYVSDTLVGNAQYSECCGSR